MRYIFVGVICALFLTGIAEGGDRDANGIKFFAVNLEAGSVAHLDGKTIDIKKGDRLEFHEYAPHSGLAPDVIDVGVVVTNRSTQTEKNFEVRLAVSPKVGKVIHYQGTPDLPLHDEIEKSAEWFTPILLLKQTVKSVAPGRNVEVNFRNIKLGSILKDYVRRGLWPVTLNFEASVEPSSEEETFRNNTVKRALKLRMWE